jgi:hypothetical protein
MPSSEELLGRIAPHSDAVDRAVRKALLARDRLAAPGIDALEEQAYIVLMAHEIQASFSAIEEILKMLAWHLDGQLPEGEHFHRELIDQLSRSSRRDRAILRKETSTLLHALRAFRHVVPKAYGSEVRKEGVLDNLQNLETAIGLLEKDIERFRQAP